MCTSMKQDANEHSDNILIMKRKMEEDLFYMEQTSTNNVVTQNPGVCFWSVQHTFCSRAPTVAAPWVLMKVSWLTGLVCSMWRSSVRKAATWFCSSLLSEHCVNRESDFRRQVYDEECTMLQFAVWKLCESRKQFKEMGLWRSMHKAPVCCLNIVWIEKAILRDRSMMKYAQCSSLLSEHHVNRESRFKRQVYDEVCTMLQFVIWTLCVLRKQF